MVSGVPFFPLGETDRNHSFFPGVLDRDKVILRGPNDWLLGAFVKTEGVLRILFSDPVSESVSLM